MKKGFLLIFLIFLFSCHNTEKRKVTIEDFNWLVGDWERTNEKADRNTYESWKKLNDTQYVGLGFTIQQKDTIWKENIRLVKEQSSWNYEVIGENDLEPTIFKLTSIEGERFTCENQENEFPKKIEYLKDGSNIKAKISGGEMEIPFEFERINKN